MTTGVVLKLGLFVVGGSEQVWEGEGGVQNVSSGHL